MLNEFGYIHSMLFFDDSPFCQNVTIDCNENQIFCLFIFINPQYTDIPSIYMSLIF